MGDPERSRDRLVMLADLQGTENNSIVSIYHVVLHHSRPLSCSILKNSSSLGHCLLLSVQTFNASSLVKAKERLLGSKCIALELLR